MKIYVCHSTQYNFKEELYKPLKNSKIMNKYEIILPHDNSEELYNSKDLFLFQKDCGYVIAEVSRQSLSIGIELGWANLNNIKIICIYQKDYKISSSLKTVSNIFIKYESEKDMIEKLEELLL